MKFLCVPCDAPMKLAEVAPPDRGSLSVRYACPECGYEMAMLTNPFETQMVQSLGVRIGPDAAAAGTPAANRSSGDASRGAAGATVPASAVPESAGEKKDGGKCPFAGMIPGLTDAARDGASDGASTAPVAWTPQASARLEAIPSFVRPMARTGIERFARERGYPTVDEKVLDEARDFFGM